MIATTYAEHEEYGADGNSLLFPVAEHECACTACSQVAPRFVCTLGRVAIVRGRHGINGELGLL